MESMDKFNMFAAGFAALGALVAFSDGRVIAGVVCVAASLANILWTRRR